MTAVALNSVVGNFGLFLRDRRLDAGLTQAALAQELGYLSSQFVSNWERGISVPPVSSLEKLAQILNTPADEMFELFLQAYLWETKMDLEKKFSKYRGRRSRD